MAWTQLADVGSQPQTRASKAVYTDGPTAHTTGPTLWVFGGYVDLGAGTVGSVKTRYYDIATDTWYTAADSPVPLAAHAVVFDGDHTVWILGCDPFTSSASTVLEYNLLSDTWINHTSTWPVPGRWDGAAVWLNGFIYYVGGMAGGFSYITPTLRLDPTSGTWTTLATPIEAHRWCDAVAVDSSIYLAGGSTPGGTHGTLERYDIASDTWAMLAAGHQADEAAMVYGSDRLIHRWGGNPGTGVGSVSRHQTYEIATDVWTEADGLPIAVQGASPASTPSRIWSIGGQTTGFGGGSLGDVYSLAAGRSKPWTIGAINIGQTGASYTVYARVTQVAIEVTATTTETSLARVTEVALEVSSDTVEISNARATQVIIEVSSNS